MQTKPARRLGADAQNYHVSVNCGASTEINGKRLIEVARGSMVVRKVVELSATRPAAPSSFHASFRCDGESRAELLDDAAVTYPNRFA